MTIRSWEWVSLGVLLCVMTTAGLAQEKGVALKEDDIKSEPFKDAKTVGTIKKGDSVSLLKKEGGWREITTTQGTGWVRVLSVRKGTAGGNAAAEIAGVTSISTGRAGTGQVVSTTGVRGLGEEDLKSAKFSEEEMMKAESAAITGNEAKQFAAKGELVARTVAWLPAPKPTAGEGR